MKKNVLPTTALLFLIAVTILAIGTGLLFPRFSLSSHKHVVLPVFRFF